MAFFLPGQFSGFNLNQFSLLQPLITGICGFRPGQAKSSDSAHLSLAIVNLSPSGSLDRVSVWILGSVTFYSVWEWWL